MCSLTELGKGLQEVTDTKLNNSVLHPVSAHRLRPAGWEQHNSTPRPEIFCSFPSPRVFVRLMDINAEVQLSRTSYELKVVATETLYKQINSRKQSPS
jgi:hypothetical protein